MRRRVKFRSKEKLHYCQTFQGRARARPDKLPVFQDITTVSTVVTVKCLCLSCLLCSTCYRYDARLHSMKTSRIKYANFKLLSLERV